MADKLRVSRLLGGDGKAFLGEYDTLGDFGKLGNVYAADGGFKDSPLAGGMIEVQTAVDYFVVANPIQAFVPEPVAPVTPPESGGGGDSGSGSAGGGGGSGSGSGGGGDGGAGGSGDGGGDAGDSS